MDRTEVVVLDSRDQPALDATLLAMSEGRKECRDVQVDSIEIETFAFAASLLAQTELRSDLHARFDLPTCVATLTLDGELHAPAFLPERLARREVAALRQRVTVRENTEFTAALPAERPTSVTITWADGSRTSTTVRNARGNPDQPLSMDEVVAKFRANVDVVLPDDVAEQCVGTAISDRRSEVGAFAKVAALVA